MKSIALLLAGLELAAGHPPNEPSHSHPSPSVSTPIPIPTGSTPDGCKVLSSDSNWPAPEEWTSALPDVTPGEASSEFTRPDYHLAVEEVASVQAAINFTAENNIRLTLVNSGHDFLGRNDAPSGLGIDLSMLNGIKVLESFTPTKDGAESPAHGDEPGTINPVPGKQAAVTFGAGASTQEINDALDSSGLFTMGAAHGSVKTAGGYSQASGHAPFSSKYGLGADQVLEYKVVTPDSQLVVANNVSNPDLFWALRGGGGSTFGIVVESTVKAFPSPKLGVVHWWINATDSENPGQGFWDSAAYLHSQFPEINEKGVQGYYYVYPDAMKGIFLTADEDSGKEKADAVWNPILNKLSSFPGMANATSEYDEYATFKEFFDATFGAMHCGEEGGHEHKRWLQKRHGDGAEPMGITPMDSRLLGEKHLKSEDLAQALKDAMPRVPDGQLRGHLVGGGKVFNPDDDTSVNPAWREAYVHLIGTGVGEFTVDSLRELAPDSGAYVNEASAANPDWKQDFWGENYERLSELKTKYDPNGVLWATPGINADEYSVVDGRVCKTPSTGPLAPENDNKNVASQSEGNEDPSSAFPGTEPPGHHHDGGCGGDDHDDDDGHDDDHGDGDGHDDGDDHDHDDGENSEVPPGVIIEPDLDASKPPVTEGAEVTKIRYGPYDVDSMDMISNRPDLNIETPCKDCYITAIQASLEYEDGTSANIDTGAWLHHMVLYNNGLGKDDLVCDSLLAPQRIYASGNERIVSRVNGVGDYGIKIESRDSIGMIYDLMNDSDSPQTYYLSITYEWLPGNTTGYKAASMAWLDITDCGLSSVPAQEGVFELRSKGWKSTVAGRLLSATGHVHDGGVDTVIYKNGEPVCTSVQVYGGKPGFTAPGGGHGGHDDGHDDGHGGTDHISGAGVCEDFGTVEVGDELVVAANYNTTAHPLDMGHDGEPHDIMGISRVYIGE